MRYAAFASGAVLCASLAACSLTNSGGECTNDQQCGDDVCARSGECLAPSNVRQVQIRWTMNGEAADSATCAAHPNLFLQFIGPDYGDTLHYAPVVCSQGSFFVDRLPRRYQQVELGVEGRTGDIVAIEPGDRASAQAQFDLPQ